MIFNYGSPSQSEDLKIAEYDFDAIAPRCALYDMSFSSNEARQQHRQDSSTHDHGCRNRYFGSNTALQQHLQNSPVDEQTLDTPLRAELFPAFSDDSSAYLRIGGKFPRAELMLHFVFVFGLAQI